MSQVLYMLLGGIDFLKFSWLLLYLDMPLLSAIGIEKSLTTATEMTCIQIEITLLLLQYMCTCQIRFQGTKISKRERFADLGTRPPLNMHVRVE